MDDIIVIILTLIFIVASIFGQKKKRSPLPETETEPLPKEDNFWDMLGQQWDETKQADSAPQQKQFEQQESVNLEPQHYTFNPEKEGAKTVTQKSKETKKAVTKIKKKKFPLREAVIYSEILNRKYT